MEELGIINSDEFIKKSCDLLCAEFKFSTKSWESLDDFMESETPCKVIIFSCLSNKTPKEIAAEVAEIAQGVSHVSPEAYLISIVQKPLGRGEIDFLKKSGVNLIFTVHDLKESSKLQFFTSQKLKASYVPIKEIDFESDTIVPMDVFHLMPLKGKFLKIAKAGSKIDKTKLQKMGEVGEFYVQRSELDLFAQYTKTIDNGSEKSTLRKCRAQFLNFGKYYLDLVEMLCDETELGTFEEGKVLLEKCESIVSELAQTLSHVSDSQVWDIVNNSVIGEFGSVERSPAIAAYATYFGDKIGNDKVLEILFAILLIDIGLIYLPFPLVKKIKDGLYEEFDSSEKSDFKSYPLKTIAILAAKKIPLETKTRDLILLINERADGKGFPNGVSASKLTEESQLIQFCKSFDNKTTLKIGQKRSNNIDALNKVLEEEGKNFRAYTPTFCQKLQKLKAG